MLDFIKELENILGKDAKKNFLSMQDGDIEKTHSDINLLRALTGFEPKTNIHEGICEFVKWYKSYYWDILKNWLLIYSEIFGLNLSVSC